MFRNGIRVAWQIHVLQGEEVLESAAVHAVEAGFVAVQERELGVRGELGKGVGDDGNLVLVAFRGDGPIEQVGLDGPEPAETPERGGHLLDEAELDIVGRLELLDVFGKQDEEVGGGLVFEDYGFGEQAVADGVGGGTLLAFRGFGAVGALPVGAR